MWRMWWVAVFAWSLHGVCGVGGRVGGGGEGDPVPNLFLSYFRSRSSGKLTVHSPSSLFARR